MFKEMPAENIYSSRTMAKFRFFFGLYFHVSCDSSQMNCVYSTNETTSHHFAGGHDKG